MKGAALTTGTDDAEPHLPESTKPRRPAALPRLVAGTLARLLLAVLVEPGLDGVLLWRWRGSAVGLWFTHLPMTFLDRRGDARSPRPPPVPIPPPGSCGFSTRLRPRDVLRCGT